MSKSGEMIIFWSGLVFLQLLAHALLRKKPAGVAFLVTVSVPMALIWAGAILQSLSKERNGWEVSGAFFLSLGFMGCAVGVLLVRLFFQWCMEGIRTNRWGGSDDRASAPARRED